MNEKQRVATLLAQAVKDNPEWLWHCLNGDQFAHEPGAPPIPDLTPLHDPSAWENDEDVRSPIVVRLAPDIIADGRT